MSEASARALELLEELEKINKTTRIEVEYGELASKGSEGGPYDWQAEWHNQGTSNPERAIIAGNRTGKTRTAAAEVAIHLTGMYPD